MCLDCSRPAADVDYNARVPRRTERLLLVLVLLAAAGLRIYHLDGVPPGWRDDEVVETVVHAALIRQGHWLLFFPQAEGHEPLYHYLSAAWISVAGQSLFIVRLLSAFFGLLSVAALYRLARRLFGGPTALLAAAALGASFWGLMYSRFKLRQVGTVAPMLLAFDFFFRAMDARAPTARRRRDGLLAAVWMAASLYTYYAARAIPLILLALAAHLWLFHRQQMRGHWRPLALAAAATAALVAPLAVAIVLTPQSQARLAVVGAPLAEMLRGNPDAVLRNTAETLAMPAFTGDPEFLYNIPGRPLFEPLGALLFGLGLLLAAWRWRQPRYAFLLLWLVGGLAPAFVSTPSASLGHTIAAQPAVYLLPALAVAELGGWARRQLGRVPRLAAAAWLPGAARYAGAALAVIFLGLLATRDWRDYFIRWPALPKVRALYRADLHEAAPALRRLPPGSDLALVSPSLQPADVLALALETPGRNLQARVFTPARAWLFPDRAVPVLMLDTAWPLGFDQAPLNLPFDLRSSSLPAWAQPATAITANFENGWQFYGYRLTLQPATASTLAQLDTYWRVTAGYHAPAPRPVDVLAGLPLPLRIFTHVLKPDGSLAAGDDQLDVDPATLRPGDTFVQATAITLPADLPAGRYALQVGLYNPASGARVPVTNDEDGLVLQTLDWPQ